MVLQSADVVAGLCSLALGMGAGVTFHGWDLWVELTGGIVGKNGWKVYAVDFQKFIKSLMVEFLPHWFAIRGEHQCTANLIEMQSPIRAVAVLRVLETAEIIGVTAARLLVFFLDC